MLAVFFYKLGAYLTCALPERVTASIAAFLGYVNYLLRFRTRRNIAINLKIILGENCGARKLRRTTRAVFMNFAQSIRLFLKLPAITDADLMRGSDFSEFDEVLRKLEPGKGFIIVTAHLGPWELGGLYMRTRNHTLHTVALDHPSRRVTAFFNERRLAANTVCHPLDWSFKMLKQALDRGECVVLLIDRDYKTPNKRFTFFGLPSCLPGSHLLLAARCGVPVIPGAFLFKPGGGFKGIFRGPYFIANTTNRLAAMDALQERCLRDLEDMIRDHPEQYFHFDSLRQAVS
ncbi:MAG: lysophospholipid acyltransferase family protein [Chitinivibrionia bacterium]|nr:lysophospholipid acyltransferase family protein [Chitinivibrionia bacterium]